MMQWTNAVLVLAGATESAPADRLGGLMQFAPIILIVVAFFWLMHRSQKKKDRQRQQLLDSVQTRDRVVTIGGIHGRVLNVKDDVIILRIDENKDVKIAVSKSAISRKEGEEASEEGGEP